MPIYMDIHKHVEGVTADAAAEAHRMDLQTQGKYGVKYEKYWLDETSGRSFAWWMRRAKKSPSVCIAKRMV